MNTPEAETEYMDCPACEGDGGFNLDERGNAVSDYVANMHQTTWADCEICKGTGVVEAYEI